MMEVIKGKHLGKVTTVDRKTGKETTTNAKMFMMPAKKGTCEECAVNHRKDQPHDKQSMFYQYKFFNEHGRWPGWADAMAHCDDEVKQMWTTHLRKLGEKV